jgi:hypothetical protein
MTKITGYIGQIPQIEGIKVFITSFAGRNKDPDAVCIRIPKNMLIRWIRIRIRKTRYGSDMDARIHAAY